jgi:DNA helicase II / ATP-dependent DNA helicase PcrA
VLHRVKLSTIEAAMGLDFDLNAGNFDGDSGDERNLFYVAASRAKVRLTFLHSPGIPSSFLSAVAANRPTPNSD